MENELGNLVNAEVARAEGDLQAFRARALSILGVSGGLVAIVSGFFAIATGATHQVKIRPYEHWLLALAFLLYVLAAVMALVVNLPANVDAPDPEKLQGFVQHHWGDTGWDQQSSLVQATYLASLRNLNKRNGKAVFTAILFEIFGLAATAGVAILIIGHAS